MSARDSFVELGYEVRDHKLLELPEPGTWSTQDEPTLTYFQKEGLGKEVITFHGYEHLVRVYGMLAGRGVPAPLNPEEVKAIYQQMVELGWLEDQDG